MRCRWWSEKTSSFNVLTSQRCLTHCTMSSSLSETRWTWLWSHFFLLLFKMLFIFLFFLFRRYRGSSERFQPSSKHSGDHHQDHAAFMNTTAALRRLSTLLKPLMVCIWEGDPWRSHPSGWTARQLYLHWETTTAACLRKAGLAWSKAKYRVILGIEWCGSRTEWWKRKMRRRRREGMICMCEEQEVIEADTKELSKDLCRWTFKINTESSLIFAFFVFICQ